MKYSKARLVCCISILLLVPFLPLQEISAQNEAETSSRFFDQLRTLFGRFRDADLDRAFEASAPTGCSELTSGDGIWRPVAFFNEDRRLGDWYHRNLAEVRGDFSEYIFSGECPTEQSAVRVVTKFAVMDSLQRYAAGRIRLEEIRMNTNAAVTASFSTANRIYFFDLPYLYLNKEKSKTDPVYTLVPQRADDRYAPEVTNHWECRSVRANDVTFQFIICQTWTLPRDREERRQSRASFGSSAYFILSDGREATTSVKLSFGGDAEKPQPETSRPISPDPVVAPNPATPATDVGPVAKWKIPESSSKLVDVEKSEFRIRFSPQTWANKSGAAQILADQKMSSLTGTKPPVGTDYCVWQPGTGNLVSRVLAAEPETGVAYTFKSADKDKASPASISVEMKTFTGSRLGTLQCFFQNADSVAAISVDRWVSIVGAHLTLEVLP